MKTILTVLALLILSTGNMMLIAPPDGGYIIENKTVFVWNGTEDCDAVNLLLKYQDTLWAFNVNSVYNFTVPHILEDGWYNWSISCYDEASRTWAYSDVQEFAVDTLPPVIGDLYHYQVFRTPSSYNPYQVRCYYIEPKYNYMGMCMAYIGPTTDRIRYYKTHIHAIDEGGLHAIDTNTDEKFELHCGYYDKDNELTHQKVMYVYGDEVCSRQRIAMFDIPCWDIDEVVW